MKTKTKRYSLTKEEIERIKNVQSVMGILALQQDALRHSMAIEIQGAKMRLAIDKPAEPGWERTVQLDSMKYELVVEDTEVEKVKGKRNVAN